MGDENNNITPLLLAAMGIISMDELIDIKQSTKNKQRSSYEKLHQYYYYD